MICLFCESEMLPYHHMESINSTAYHCFKCCNNNYIFSYIQSRLNNNITSSIALNNYINLLNNNKHLQLSKITPLNIDYLQKITEKHYADGRAFNINDTVYVTTKIYTIFEPEPTNIIIQEKISIEYEYFSDRKIITVKSNFIEKIKSAKDPEDAVNIINTLVLFN